MTPRLLPLATGIALPLDAVTQKLAFMGKTGSGKTYAAGKLVEGMLDAGAQVVVIDPVGAWHGLRLAGTGAGYQVPVLGGLHGDIPIEPTGGAVVAELVAKRPLSLVVDVSQMTSGEQARFVTDFATRFFELKKAAPSAVHLVLEECQEMVPQNAQPGEQRMLHAFERMVKLGRNFGIGVSLISQRPQEVNKKALNQTECLFAFQMTGPQERKAMAAWMSDKGVETELVDALPALKPGHCFVWSPSWLGISKQVHILPKRSADASSTPKVGVAARAVEKLTPIDLGKLLGEMASTVERAKENDPAVLRKRIAELERQVKEQAGHPKEVPVFTLGDREAIDSIRINWDRVLREMGEGSRRMNELLAVLERTFPIEDMRIAGGRTHARPAAPPIVHRDLKPEKDRPAPTPAPRATGAAAGVRSGARHILATAARHHPEVLSRSVLAARAGFAASSGTYSTYLGDLKKAGLLDENLGATAEGLASSGAKPRTPMTRDEIVGQWRGLRAGARKMLALVLERGSMTRDEIADAAEFVASSGTFSTYLGDLRKPGLIAVERGAITVGPAFAGARL